MVNNGEQVWLVMEYVDGGDLHNFLTKVSLHFSGEGGKSESERGGEAGERRKRGGGKG